MGSTPDAAIQAITLAIALLGAALGVLNTWRNWNMDRVKVRVRPGYSVGYPGDQHCIHIEVVNLSSFPVTIVSVGFTVIGGATHLQIPRPILNNAEKLPHRLETRTSLTVLVPLTAMEKDALASISKAYVKTACGIQVEGDSPALRDVVNAAFTSTLGKP